MFWFSMGGLVGVLIYAAVLLRSEICCTKKIQEMAFRLAEQYPGSLIMYTSQGAAIYIIEDYVWIDSGYLEEYIDSPKVNWQREGF